MITIELKDKYILGILAALTLFTFYIRIIPLLTFQGSPISILAPDDPIYNLRLVEQVVKHGVYPWFDPMTFFPQGTWLNWGPLFTYICAAFSIMAGATSTESIAYVSMFVPPLLAALCIPLTFYIGKLIGDWKTGLVAAIFMAFMSGQFFQRSVAGYLDHHIAEVLFSLLFIFIYIYSIKNLNDKNHIWLSIIAGVAFFAGVMVMPTMILFALVAWIFSFIWLYLTRDQLFAMFNMSTFAITAILFVMLIPWTIGWGLDIYSVAHIFAYVIVIVTSFIFVYKEGNWWWAFAFIGFMVVTMTYEFRNLVIGSVTQFFGQTQYTATVQEARAWSLNDALTIYNVILPLSVVGMVTLVYSFIKERKGEVLFIAIWSISVLLATVQHVRYEYYFAPVAALTTAYMFAYGINALSKPPTDIPQPKKLKKEKEVKKVETKVKQQKLLRTSFIIFTIATIGIFIASVVPGDMYFAENVRFGITPEWTEPLEWMRTNTPSDGMDYNALYTAPSLVYPKPAYKYPDESYGVMSWWDYGHIIQFYSHRMPNANPFQQGVAGQNGAAKFFISDNELNATHIMDADRTKYVITDIEMATGKFWAMGTWADVNPAEYMGYSSTGTPEIYAKYLYTMIGRLHMMDGTFIRQVSPDGKETIDVPALQHFRLVRESPSDIGNGMRYVKVFEYVKGANVYDGLPVGASSLIQTNITTNSGRVFTYSQVSSGGKWIVPYPGQYKTDTGKTVIVTNDDVERGNDLLNFMNVVRVNSMSVGET